MPNQVVCVSFAHAVRIQKLFCGLCRLHWQARLACLQGSDGPLGCYAMLYGYAWSLRGLPSALPCHAAGADRCHRAQFVDF